uniref:Uncharacterized protein n=1 Tax=Timema monikensis TaxID=170555 RepID=A0A7R9EM17_9NEOP|nr:unnamed protein product [Timema monikensis]
MSEGVASRDNYLSFLRSGRESACVPEVVWQDIFPMLEIDNPETRRLALLHLQQMLTTLQFYATECLQPTCCIEILQKGSVSNGVTSRPQSSSYGGATTSTLGHDGPRPVPLSLRLVASSFLTRQCPNVCASEPEF